MPETAADDLLTEPGLVRHSTIAYIDAAIRRGQSQVADEVQVPQQSVDLCWEAFESMAVDERAELIASLFEEWRDVIPLQSYDLV